MNRIVKIIIVTVVVLLALGIIYFVFFGMKSTHQNVRNLKQDTPQLAPNGVPIDPNTPGAPGYIPEPMDDIDFIDATIDLDV